MSKKMSDSDVIANNLKTNSFRLIKVIKSKSGEDVYAYFIRRIGGVKRALLKEDNWVFDLHNRVAGNKDVVVEWLTESKSKTGYNLDNSVFLDVDNINDENSDPYKMYANELNKSKQRPKEINIDWVFVQEIVNQIKDENKAHKGGKKMDLLGAFADYQTFFDYDENDKRNPIEKEAYLNVSLFENGKGYKKVKIPDLSRSQYKALSSKYKLVSNNVEGMENALRYIIDGLDGLEGLDVDDLDKAFDRYQDKEGLRKTIDDAVSARKKTSKKTSKKTPKKTPKKSPKKSGARIAKQLPTAPIGLAKAGKLRR